MPLQLHPSDSGNDPHFSEEARRTMAGMKPLFRKIVVAVDGSSQADAAADLVGAMAQQFGAEVVLVNVFWAQRDFAPECGLIGPDPRPACLRASDALLTRVRRRLPEDVKVATVTAEGDAAEQILATADRSNANLIAVGTHGRGRIAQAVLGSVASTVMRKSRCPVLTVSHVPEATRTMDAANASAVA